MTDEKKPKKKRKKRKKKEPVVESRIPFHYDHFEQTELSSDDPKFKDIMDFVFEDTFEEFLEAKNKEREDRKRRIGEYYPSELGYCLRKCFIDFHYKTEVDVRTLKIFFRGNMIQDHLLSPVLEWKFGDKVHKAERPITVVIDDPKTRRLIRLRGRVDDHMRFRDGVILPIEGKTQGAWLSKKTEPSDHHVAQIYPYLVAANAGFGYLVYIESKMQPKPGETVSKTFKVKFNYEKWEELRSRVLYLDRCLRESELPFAEARHQKHMSWNCSYTCNWGYECKMFGNDKVCFKDTAEFMSTIEAIGQARDEV